MKNRQSEIDLLKESGEKRRRQIRLNYDKEIAELAAQEKKWRDAQKGSLTDGQESSLKERVRRPLRPVTATWQR